MRSGSPTGYNAAADLIERNLAAGRGAKTAFIDDRGHYSYAELAERVSRFANLVRRSGIHPRTAHPPVSARYDRFSDRFSRRDQGRGRSGGGQYPALCRRIRLHAGGQPGPGGGRVGAGAADHGRGIGGVVGSAAGGDRLRKRRGGALAGRSAGADADHVRYRVDPSGRTLLLALLLGFDRPAEGHRACPFEPDCRPRELYAVPVLGIAESDVVFSAAKLFFAYGLGNSLTFPMTVGATSVLTAERPTPAAVAQILRRHRPTIFYGVPTLYNAMLASTELPRREELALRRCVSAGEPLPQEIGRRWSERVGVDILDGIGSTEMLHIFLSNRPGEVRYGTTGRPIPGYELGIVDEQERRSGAARSAIFGQWPDQRRLLLEQSRALPDDLYGPVDPHRRQIFRRRRRLLRLLRPQRRHDEGQRDVCLSGRGRGGAHRPRERARSRRRRRPGPGRPDQAKAFVVAKPGIRADEELAAVTGRPREGGCSLPSNVRAGLSFSMTCQRPPPARSSASSSASPHPTLPRVRGREGTGLLAIQAQVCL